MMTGRQHHRTLFPLSRLLLLSGFVVGLPTAAPAAADPPEVMTIVDQMKAVFEPGRPSLRKMVITVSSDEGHEKARWIAGVARKEFPDGKRNLIVLLEPESVRANALLIFERGGQEDVMWVYAPSVQRVRGIMPVDAYEHFLRTDFTYADLGFVSRRGNYRFLGEEEHAGVRAYKIEEVPADRWYYSRILTWVSAETLLPLQRDYYDRAGRLWKTALFDQVAVIDGVPTPLRVRMLEVQQDTSTELRMSEVRYDVELPDELFEPRRLREAIHSPLWQPYRAQVAQGKAAPEGEKKE
jgi:outer membrane lipoprotein-sorting protein